jgi:predicted cupin superfamily sugar epimerase
MHARAAHLLEVLELSPHPEGGSFREFHRSELEVQPGDDRGRRAALTTIYCLLIGGQPSRWHRVRSDEVWHHLEGDPLELLSADPGLERVGARLLGPHAGDAEPVRVIEAGWWQAARSTGAYTLVSCTVGPGFVFEDFVLLRDLPEHADTLRRSHPLLAELL